MPVDVPLNWLNWFHFLIVNPDRLHDFSVTIPRFSEGGVHVNSFFPRTARLWNSLPVEYFPLTYDINGVMVY